MTPEQLFITATRKAYRWESPQGSLSIEQLWNLPLSTSQSNKASLDNVAQGVYSKINSTKTVSFVGNSASTTEDENKLEIVKFIIQKRQEENQKELAKKQTMERLSLVNDLLEKKKLDKIAGQSEEELEALQKSLLQSL